MHDRPFHQATGLLGTARLNPPRLMALVSHGDEQAELPLLWRLCSAFVELGYPVSVLDGTTLECADNPGLSHVLDYAFWRSTPTDVPSWTVIPAALGLQTLCALPDHSSSHLHELGSLFPAETAIIMYGRADILSTLLQGSGVQPVLAVSSAKAPLLSGYLALKRLLLQGRITPTTVTVDAADATDSASKATVSAQHVAHSLEDCAKYFLHYDLHPHRITLPPSDAPAGHDVERLALRMLESALPLSPAHLADLPLRAGHTSMQTIARSH
jgi:hypothetical protein